MKRVKFSPRRWAPRRMSFSSSRVARRSMREDRVSDFFLSTRGTGEPILFAYSQCTYIHHIIEHGHSAVCLRLPFIHRWCSHFTFQTRIALKKSSELMILI